MSRIQHAINHTCFNPTCGNFWYAHIIGNAQTVSLQIESLTILAYISVNPDINKHLFPFFSSNTIIYLTMLCWHRLILIPINILEVNIFGQNRRRCVPIFHLVWACCAYDVRSSKIIIDSNRLFIDISKSCLLYIAFSYSGTSIHHHHHHYHVIIMLSL